MAQLHTIQPNTYRKDGRRIGRGGKRGTTSGRGTKGQMARSGHKLRPELRDIIRKLPKKRGYGAERMGVKPEVINLGVLENIFETGSKISPKVLLDKGLVRRISGHTPAVKILGTGDVTKSFEFEKCIISASAKTKIEKAGGKILQGEKGK